MALPRILKDLLTLPTAPFAESMVLEHIEQACRRLAGVTLKRDRFGNLLARYRRQAQGRTPIAFTAHTDHPGFVALGGGKSGTLRAAFRGWVEPEYFPTARVKFWSAGRWHAGRVQRITRTARVYRMIGRTARPEEVEIALDRSGVEIAVGAPGMWNLPDARERGGNVLARGCDDIAGCAAMLALLERLSAKRAKADVYCLFTRAEEVGFAGAIGAAKIGTLPRRVPIIAIETSKALPNARIGDGPILRVGDKSSVFTPEVTAFCDRVARDLSEKRKTFKYQRKLMDGGTCESTAYWAYGYAATGICVALGNYHNMNVEKKRIDSEYISLSDWTGMVDWFEALSLTPVGFGDEGGRLRAGLEQRFEKWKPLLLAK